MDLSATIITFNEQKNIARAIRSLDFASEVIVIDSGSSDETCEIARELGALVFHNPFPGYGQQKNFAAQKASHQWILSIDADEEVTPELKESIINAISQDDPAPLMVINRRTSFCNKWIYHGGWYPDRLVRLYKKDQAKWTEPEVHEELKAIDSNTAHPPILKGHLNHYSFPTCQSQIETNIKYAKLGSETLLTKGRPCLLKAVLKPIGKFIECYFLKMGILDGKAGLIIALNASYSIFMKYLFAWDNHD